MRSGLDREGQDNYWNTESKPQNDTAKVAEAKATQYIWVNPDHIVSATEWTDKNGEHCWTQIRLQSYSSYDIRYVTETVESISRRTSEPKD